LEAFDTKQRPKRRGEVTFASFSNGMPFLSTSPLVRRDVLLEVGGFAEDRQDEHGAELWVGLARLGYRYIDARHVGVAHRGTPVSSTPTGPGGRPIAEERATHPHVRGREVGPPPRTRITGRDLLKATDGAVVLVPEARYHVDELGPIADVLEDRGVRARFMQTPHTAKAAVSELGRFTDMLLPFEPEAVRHAAAVVVMNDWGPARHLVDSANEVGVPTFAKVEGVQDFDDLESGDRRPYRRSAFILAQGENDVVALREKTTFVVGNSRLERLWLEGRVRPGITYL
jgi:hypothetical protein